MSASTPVPKSDARIVRVAPKAAVNITLSSKPVLTYAYAPYNEGKLDPQLTSWPLSPDELTWVTKGKYFRKPGHDVQKHLPDMWFVTPTAARWGNGSPEL